MDHWYVKRLYEDLSDAKKDKYLVARDLGLSLHLKLVRQPITQTDDVYAALGSDFIELLEKHNLMPQAPQLDMVCGLCGADIRVAGSLRQTHGVWVCSYPVPRNDHCFERAVKRAAEKLKGP